MRVKDICMSCMKEKGAAAVCPYCGWNESTPPASPTHLVAGTILLNRYIVGKVLGQGSCGITYMGYDILHMELRAIKEYLPTLLTLRAADKLAVTLDSKPEARPAFREGYRRFIEEGEALKAFCGDAGIVHVHECIEANDTAYIIMSLIKGQPLGDYLAGLPHRMNFNDAIRLMMPVLGALSRVHHAGMLHRDVTPDNILVDDEGKAWLIDFGTARYVVAEKIRNPAIALTDGFAPCEQHYSLAAQGSWTDIYGAAAVLYYIMAGQAPPESLARIHRDSLIAPSRLDVDIPDYAEAALLKALAVRANERYQRISEFVNDLRRARSDSDKPEEEQEPEETLPAEHPDQLRPLHTNSSLYSAKLEAESHRAGAVPEDDETSNAEEPSNDETADPETSPSPDRKAPDLKWLFNRRTLKIMLIIIVLGFIIGLLGSLVRSYVIPEVETGALVPSPIASGTNPPDAITALYLN